MSLPYFAFYPTDFEADTSHLTLEEDGAYNRLLRLCWMSPGCSLPDDDAWIMRRLRVDQDAFDRVVRIVLDEFFDRRAGRVSNARLTREFVASGDKHSRRVSAGKLGGTAKAQKTKGNSPSNARAMPKQPEPEPEPEQEEEEDANASLSDLPKKPPVKFSPKPPPTDDGFEAFWEAVPRKVAKGAAKKAYAKALRLTDSAALFSAMKAYAAERRGEPEQYTAHPASWLNAERWSDEPAERKPDAADDARRIADIYRRKHGLDSGPGAGAAVALFPARR